MKKMTPEELHAFINAIVSLVANGYPTFIDDIHKAEYVKITSTDPSFIRAEIGYGCWGLGEGYDGTEFIIDSNRIILSEMDGMYSLADIKTTSVDELLSTTLDAYLL